MFEYRPAPLFESDLRVSGLNIGDKEGGALYSGPSGPSGPQVFQPTGGAFKSIPSRKVTMVPSSAPLFDFSQSGTNEVKKELRPESPVPSSKAQWTRPRTPRGSFPTARKRSALFRPNTATASRPVRHRTFRLQCIRCLHTSDNTTIRTFSIRISDRKPQECRWLCLFLPAILLLWECLPL